MAMIRVKPPEQTTYDIVGLTEEEIKQLRDVLADDVRRRLEKLYGDLERLVRNLNRAS